MHILVTIYQDPVGYPPTLNAVSELAKMNHEVTVICKKHYESNWEYPASVNVVHFHSLIHINQLKTLPIQTKVRLFLQYVKTLRQHIRSQKPVVVLCYDNIALLGYWLATQMISKRPLLWYHNHDVLEMNDCRKYSIQWFSGLLEPRIFRKINIFSLPSNERKKYFPLDTYNGAYFFLPNYPSVSFYRRFFTPDHKYAHAPVKLIYQGTITPSHGLEEIIPYLKCKLDNKEIRLTLIGPISDSYKENLLHIADTHDVRDYLQILPPVPYENLPQITAEHHIGLAINIPHKIIYATGGTASNKIYEYAAVGLPVLLYDMPHYREHLDTFAWSFFTDLTEKTFIESLSGIVQNYDFLRQRAWKDFNESLNFGVKFKPLMDYITQKIS